RTVGQVPADDAVAVSADIHVGGEDEVANRSDAAGRAIGGRAPAGSQDWVRRHMVPSHALVGGAAQERSLGAVENLDPGSRGVVRNQMQRGCVSWYGNHFRRLELAGKAVDLEILRVADEEVAGHGSEPGFQLFNSEDGAGLPARRLRAAALE